MSDTPKQEAELSVERVALQQYTRFNPLPNLSPELLSRLLSQYHRGYLRELMLVWDAIEGRDDRLKSVVPKRKKSVARRRWEVTPLDDSADAKRHQEALEFFYRNCSAVNAVDPHERGGFARLARQMMDAVGKGHAVHEIIWQPRVEGLTAEFRFVPLWFFERKTGPLRFLRQDYDLDGAELEEGGWMVTVGDRLMEPCSVCYMFKKLSVSDWVNFNDKFATPGVHAETDAQPGSSAWNSVVEAVRTFRKNWGSVTSTGTKFNLLEARAGATNFFEALNKEMNSAMTILWRGGDLSTSSRADSVGASLQGEETDDLEIDDALMLSETLQAYVDPWVIRYACGDEFPLAKVQVVIPERKDLEKEVAVDEFLRDSGAPLAVDETLKRYNRSMPSKGDALLEKPAAPENPANPAKPEKPAKPAEQMANERANEDPAQALLRNSLARVAQVSAEWLAPLDGLIGELAAKAGSGISDAEFLAFADQISERIPELFGEMDHKLLADEIEAASGTAVLQGLTQALRK